MDELKAQKVDENTLVLFISDNGRPFPRDKTTLFDSGIRTPWLLRWPKEVKAGTVNGELVSSVDIAPTFLELAGIRPPKFLAGTSFLPLLENKNRTIRPYIYAEKNWHDLEDRSRAVRSKRYKYIRNFYNDLPLTLQLMRCGVLPTVQCRSFVTRVPSILRRWYALRSPEPWRNSTTLIKILSS